VRGGKGRGGEGGRERGKGGREEREEKGKEGGKGPTPPQKKKSWRRHCSAVAEINRGSKFLNAPIAPTPINFGPESCFCKLLLVLKLCKK